MSSIKDRTVSVSRTICEVHRELYDILLKDKNIPDDVANKMILLLEDAYKMAKKMNNKLRQYKYNYDDSWWEQNRNIEEKLKTRKVKHAK